MWGVVVCVATYTLYHTMDLPYDIMELISGYLTSKDLANVCAVDTGFRPFFIKKIAPAFTREMKNISKIMVYLKRLFELRPTSNDIMDSKGDHNIMSHILGKCIEDGEILDNQTDYLVWQTMDSVIDSSPTMHDLVSEYGYYKDGNWDRAFVEADDYSSDLQYAYMG